MKRIAACIIGCMVLLVSCKKEDVTNTKETVDDTRSGGATTVYDVTSKCYSYPAANLTGAALQKHLGGDAVFEATFVTAPAQFNAGLGPLFNNVSCVSCHRGDGRGNSPFSDFNDNSLLLRLSLSGVGDHGAPLPVPGFGNQLQPLANVGVQSEGSVQYSSNIITGTFADGELYTLLQPVFTISGTYTTLPAGTLVSPRATPPNFGLGLLEAIDESAILANTDEADANGDGISGKANYVWDAVNNRVALGRFGWKANQPNILQQTAAAFNGDIGITTPVFPDENTKGQPQDITAHAPEVTNDDLQKAAYYVQTLGVPARRNTTDPAVQQGKKIFSDAKCNACHIPQFTTGVLSGVPEVSNQVIFPYTDLLLHDMGGDLSDNRPDYLATGNEWRTPPLWGIGLAQTVNRQSYFLHDGRARTLMEAILWHGGEAEQSRQYVKKLSHNQREALIAFLKSL
jgi:CxxC motif-containing protein (DUF1111 family)